MATDTEWSRFRSVQSNVESAPFTNSTYITHLWQPYFRAPSKSLGNVDERLD